MKSPSATVTQCRSKRSARKVSRKREYCRYRPETFGNFSRELFFLGVWRPLSECKKAPILRDFRDGGVSYLKVERVAGWRRSADRTRLRANSLLTGNFTGIFWLW